MSDHHGDNPSPHIQAALRAMLDITTFRGAVGDYPAGRLCPADEGALQFSLGERDGKVLIDFGQPVAWMGMSPQQAADFASALLKHARAVGRKKGEIISFAL